METAIMTPPAMPDIDVMWHCFRHFHGLDVSNAAIHAAEVRYSPITFRLQEHLIVTRYRDEASVLDVMRHNGAYTEDTGR
jgi:hypothetical protein